MKELKKLLKEIIATILLIIIFLIVYTSYAPMSAYMEHIYCRELETKTINGKKRPYIKCSIPVLFGILPDRIIYQSPYNG